MEKAEPIVRKGNIRLGDRKKKIWFDTKNLRKAETDANFKILEVPYLKVKSVR